MSPADIKDLVNRNLDRRAAGEQPRRWESKARQAKLATGQAPGPKHLYPQPAPGHEESTTEVLPAAQPVVFDGYYTLVSPRDGSHRTLRVRTQPADARFAPGEQVIALLTGPCNEGDYTGFGIVSPTGHLSIWRRHKGTDTAKIGACLVSMLTKDALGLKLAAAGYEVQESRRCRRCFRLLTTPESITMGIGPECAKK